MSQLGAPRVRMYVCMYVCMYVIENEDYCCCCLFVSTRKYFILINLSINRSLSVVTQAQNKIDNNESIKGKKLSTECLK